MTIRRLLLSLLLAVFLIVAGSWYWLLHTQHGASWAWSVAVSATDEALAAESLSGDLSSGVTIHRLTYNSDGVDVSVGTVTAAIDIRLFSKSVTVAAANAGDVTVTLKQGDDSSAPVQINEVLEGLQLPVELVFPELAISNITVADASESDPFVIDGVTLSGRWRDEITADINLAVHPGLAGQSVPMVVDANLNSDFESLHVDATAEIAGTDTRATLASDIDLQNETLSGQLEWDSFRWPLDGAAAQFESQTGAVTLAGTLDAWKIDGTLNVLVPQVPEGTFTVSAEGDRESVVAEIIDGDVLGGSVAGNAEYSWQAEKRFAANLVASGIRTDTLVPDWPMTLSGSIAAEGTQEPLVFSVDVADVRGNVLGKPLSADGRFDYRETDWLFDNLRVLHGESVAMVNGNPYTTEGASFDVTVDQIGHYVTDAQGTFNAAGNLSLTGQLPRLQIEGTALDLAYGSIGASEVTITDQSASGGNLNLEFAASEVAVGGVSADNALLKLYVDADQQTADISIENADLQAGLSAEGSLDNWTEPSAWSGNMNSFDLLAFDYSVALESPVGLHVSQTRATIDEFQFVGDHDVRLFGSTSWTAAEGISVSASLGTVPLNLINTFFETGLTFDQSLTGQLNLQLDPDGAPTGRGDIAMTPGSVVSNDDPEVAFSTDEARVGFDLDGGGLRTGIIDIPLPGQGQIAAEFDVTDVSVDGSAYIDAIIDVDLADIGVLAPLLPLIDDAAGSLFIDLVVGGSVESPSMQGDFSLQRGALVYLPIGLVLEDIEIASEVRDDGEVELKGTFRAGDGVGRINTRSGREQRAANGIELALAGDYLVLIDVPDVRAVANADVQVAFDGRTLNVEGDLTIPSARIRPSNIGASKVYESEDVIIVAGELPEEPVAQEGTAAIEIFGNLRTSLGDDVTVDLDVAEAGVTGDVGLTWSGELIPMADGRLTIDGEILAFGRRLDITEGQIRFPRGPVDDPYLRLRAEREIYGNTQVRRAGLLVAGSLQRPTIEAYTNPMTTEERALTLLVTGSDFDLERGVGSVDFGTYIAPKVFVSYGVGLFDTDNVIRVRYDLKKGFGITGTSGARDSGLDLSYRFEN